MTTQKCNISINTLTDKANFILYGAVQGGICAGLSYYVADPAITVSAMALSYRAWTSTRLSSALFLANSMLVKDVHLLNAMLEASQKLGISSPPLLLVLKGEQIWAGLSCCNKEPFVAVSSSFLYGMPYEEKAACIAHEVAHLAAKHIDKHRVVSSLELTTQLAGKLNLVAITLKSLFDFATKAPEVTLAIDVLGAEIFTAWAVAKVTATAAKYINAHYSRSCEFQADRIAAEVTGDPLSLVSALVRVNDYNAMVNFIHVKEYPDRMALIFHHCQRALFDSHPQTHKRCARLEKIANKQLNR